MQKRESRDSRLRLIVSLAVLGLVFALVLLPYQFRSEAVTGPKDRKQEAFQRTVSHQPGLDNYDIRLEKSEKAYENRLKFRQFAGRSALSIADVRDGFVAGEKQLRTRVKTLQVEYNRSLVAPEVITPDAWKHTIERLTGPSRSSNAKTLREFAKQNNRLFGMEDGQIDNLKVTADYTNPSGNMAFVRLEQEIDGVPVFGAELKAGFTKRGEMIRAINNLAPGLDYANLSTDFRDPTDAVVRAYTYINRTISPEDLPKEGKRSNDLRKVYGESDFSITAEKMYFPMEAGVAVPAWRVLIWLPTNAYYVIVDAEQGTLLWRKNLTEDQTESASYRVYGNTNAMIDIADSPNPISPGPLDPSIGTQGARISRTLKTLVGNEGNYSFNQLGWITDGNNTTDGNNVQAGLDRESPNSQVPVQPTDIDPSGMATGNPNRVFDFAFDPGDPTNPGAGDSPLPMGQDPATCLAQGTNDPPTDYQMAITTQLFYIANRYHDEMYLLGFTEEAGNFQDTNFSGMGVGGDRVSAQAQDCSGTNNANFTTPSDGTRGSAQMYIFTGPTPDHDGSLDADVVVHEFTHGLSNRLHGDSTGLTTNHSRNMGEGWSDFYAHAMLSEPNDPVNGIYSTGAYATFEGFGLGTTNSYYGIRRFPKAPIAFTGGPNNRPHNPLTFADLNAGCDLSDGAFPPGFTGSCDQVHNGGEIWSSALWEIRALMITRLGWAVGNRRVLQIVTDGMKLAPPAPTFLTERDAIIMAASALSALPATSADVDDVKEGFRRRGMGFSASIQGISPAQVTEAFDYRNVHIIDPIVVSDAPGDNDGFPEPGENIVVSVPVENDIGIAIANVAVSINGGAPVDYGDIADGNMVTMDVPYTIPASLAGSSCGALFELQINVTSELGAQIPTSKSIRLGEPIGGGPLTFTSDTMMNIPSGQPSTTSGASDVYPSTISVSGVSGAKAISVELTNLAHTWPGDLDVLLEGPGGQKFIIMSDAFEQGSNPAVTTTLTIQDDAAQTMPENAVPPTSGTFKPTNSNAGIGSQAWDAPAPAGPYESPAPAGTATFESVFGTDGSTMNGDWKLWIMDDAGGDSGTMDGWKISFGSNEFICSTRRTRFDFDGDHKADPSIFRKFPPSALTGTDSLVDSSSQFWMYGSGGGPGAAFTFGTPTDLPVPADYTGDGKADGAFFRPSDGFWYILRSEDMLFYAFPFGSSGDIPAPGDFDADGMADAAVYRPSEGNWYIRRSSDGQVVITHFGLSGDKPMVGDYDGDGTDDIAIWRPSEGEFWQLQSTDGLAAYKFGTASDVPVVGDFTGDGADDVAFFRPSAGFWYIIQSETDLFFGFPWGLSTDLPAPGDFDGDGTTDAAIFRPSDGTWYIRGSTAGFIPVTFGLAGDLPLPAAFQPTPMAP